MNRVLTSTAALLLLSTLTFAADKKSEISPDVIADNIFVGQIYPSGRAYLQGFDPGMDSAKKKWPATIFLRGSLDGDPVAKQFRRGEFSEMSLSGYIPGIERMDDSHNKCGEGENYEKNTAYGYLSNDYFNAVFDYCDSNENIAVYKTTYKGDQSYPVIALGTKLTMENVRILGGSDKRPLALGESEELALKKQEAQSQLGCMTVPNFFDNALLLLEMDIADTPYHIRLSTYDDPGCAGHLATNYLLDVLQEGKNLKRYQLFHYQGPV